MQPFAAAVVIAALARNSARRSALQNDLVVIVKLWIDKAQCIMM
jgi:hypothetical protein